MSYQSFFADTQGNFGPLTLMNTKPYWKVDCVTKGLDHDDMTKVDYKEIEMAHILVDKRGVQLETGYVYKFTIRLHCAHGLSIERVNFEGPVLDIVGSSRNMSCYSQNVFVINPERRYYSMSRMDCDSFELRTKMITVSDHGRLYVKPHFRIAHELTLTDIPSLDMRIRMLPCDLKIFLPSGTALDIHSIVAAANSAFFKAAMDFGRHSGEATDKVIRIEDDSFSDEAWRAAVEFMYKADLFENSIELLQDLVMIGDKYMICSLTLMAVRRLICIVDDEVYAQAGPYVISLMTMAVHYMSRGDETVSTHMNLLLRSCEGLIRSNNTDLFQSEEFCIAFADFLKTKKHLLKDDDLLIGPVRTPVRVLGKRTWGTY